MAAERAHWRALLAAMLIGALFTAAQVARPLDLRAIDATFWLLRQLRPRAPASDIVIVGLDEATLAASPEPLAMFNRRLGALLEAMAAAGARAVALDLVLPARSYDDIAPGNDVALLRGILAARRAGIVVVARTIDDEGSARPVLPAILAAAGPGGSALSLLAVDIDGQVRRIDEGIGADGEHVPTFAGTLARRLGKTDVRSGWIDFDRPLGVAPLSMQALLAEVAVEGGDAMLRRRVGGKIVFVGALLPFLDRHRVPAALAGAQFPPRSTPGVYIQAQALHTLLHGGPRPELNGPAWLAAALLAGVAWRTATTRRTALLVAIGGSVALIAFATAMLAAGFVVPVASAALALLVAVLARFGWKIYSEVLARRNLRRLFSGYVSPTVLAELEAGRLEGVTSSRRFLCVLFLDIRGFTALSESETPERVTATLNVLFEAATAIVHGHGGTVKEFMGDGLMALFGAPAELPNAAQSALDASRAMLAELPKVNDSLQSLGQTPIDIGIGLACGDAVVGHIGSTARHTYGAVGDCVNLASRLEGLTQALGYPLLLSSSVRERIADDGRLAALGRHAVKGHTPIDVHGWR